LWRISRQIVKSILNPALTARVGLDEIEVCIPLSLNYKNAQRSV